MKKKILKKVFFLTIIIFHLFIVFKLERDRKRKGAQDLSMTAQQSFDRGDFDDSINNLENALKTTDKDDRNISTYRRNIVHAMAAKSNQEGKNLMLQGDAKGAVEKFKQALNTLSPQRIIFFYDNQQYIDNLAEAYNKIGREHFEKQEFDEAKEFYQLAVNANSSDTIMANLYKKNLKTSISAVRNKDAEKLNSEGWHAFNRGYFSDAATKFSSASMICDHNYANREQFISNSNRAEANALNMLGEKLFKEKKYREALEKFRKASEKLEEAKKTTTEEINDSFQRNLNKAQAEVHNHDGEVLHVNGNFEGAIKKFNDALIVLPNTEIQRKVAIKNNLANTHNEYGKKLLKIEKFNESMQQFNLAVNNASLNYEKLEEMKKNLKVAKFEVVYAESKIFHKHERFHEALERLDLAMEILPEEKEHLRDELIESKSAAINGIGDRLFKKGSYQEAKVRFEQARALTKKQSLKIQLTTKIEKAQISFFEITYNTEMINLPIYSDEVAARWLMKILALFDSTMITMGANAPNGMSDKLLTIMKELTNLRAFDQVFKAAEIGKKYFPERSNDYKEVLDAQNKLKEDKDYLKKLGMKTMNDDNKKDQLAVKFYT